MNRSLKIPLYLTLLFTAPFVALSIAVSFHLFDDTRSIIHILLTYAGIIISFLGGIHWGLGVTQYNKQRKIANLLILESIIPSIVAWTLPMLHDIHLHLLALTMLYVFMWCIDSLLYEHDIIPQWFFNIRCIITPIVVVSLYVAYFGLMQSPLA